MTTIEERKSRTLAIWSETTWEEVAAYIGPNADKFRSTWEKQRNFALAQSSGKIAWSFCWPAFLLSFAWFFYRKQWFIGAMLIVVPVVLSYFTSAGGSVGVGLVLACMAKSAYLQDAMPKIAKVKEKLPPGDSLMAALAAAGGVSRPAGIIGGICFGLLAVAAVITVINSH